MDRKIEKKRWTKKRIIWLGLILTFVILIGYGLSSVGGASTLRIDPEKITISEVTKGEMMEFISMNGTITPIRTFYLDASEGGRVEKRYVEEGSFVDVGDDLLLLDNTDLHLDIMYREAQLFEQINNLRNTRLAIEQQSLNLRDQLLEVDYQISTSKRKFKQATGMIEKNLISQDDFEQARDNYDYWTKKRDLTIETQHQDSILRAQQVKQLELSVDRMQANLGVVKQKLENLTVTAPIKGQLTSLYAEVGASIARGEHLGQIDVLDGFKIRADVDEYYIARVSVGQKGEVKIAGVDYKLEIKKVYPEVRQGRFQVDLEFIEGEPDGLRRGQTVKVRLWLSDMNETIMIARGGFFQTTGGNWIFKLDKSEKYATRTKIGLGVQNPQYYEVLDGLKPGDKVITSPYENFEDYEKLIFK